MLANTANDTTIAGTRFEGARCASGRLSGCVSLSDVSAKTFPFLRVSAQSQFHLEGFTRKTSCRVDDLATARLRGTHLKTAFDYGLMRLIRRYRLDRTACFGDARGERFSSRVGPQGEGEIMQHCLICGSEP
jgi:hypothetical protein